MSAATQSRRRRAAKDQRTKRRRDLYEAWARGDKAATAVSIRKLDRLLQHQAGQGQLQRHCADAQRASLRQRFNRDELADPAEDRVAALRQITEIPVVLREAYPTRRAAKLRAQPPLQNKPPERNRDLITPPPPPLDAPGLPKTKKFLHELIGKEILSRKDAMVFLRLNTSSVFAMQSALDSRPSLRDQVDVTRISTDLFEEYPEVTQRFQAAKAQTSDEPLAMGAMLPDFPEGTEAEPIPDEILAYNPSLFDTDRVEFLCPTSPWPVRDQGSRGSCVAFAMTAAMEQPMCPQGIQDLSEQFLYWAIKSNPSEPFPGQEGTWIEFAQQMVQQHGICLETLWPYNPKVIPGNVDQGDPHIPLPSTHASQDALTRIPAGPRYHRFMRRDSGRAQVIRDWLLERERPVAVSLPVYRDPGAPGPRSNWTEPEARTHGHVQGPVEGDIASGGHAVCIVGYRPDPEKFNGGVFVFRNSWGTAWGHMLPDVRSPDERSPAPDRAPGYGVISAYYIDRYCSEAWQA